MVFSVFGYSRKFFNGGHEPGRPRRVQRFDAEHGSGDGLRLGFSRVYDWRIDVDRGGRANIAHLARMALSILDSRRIGAITALIIFVFYRDLSPRVRELLESANSKETDEKDDFGDQDEIVQAQEIYDDGKKVYRSPRLWLLSTVIIF